MTSDDHASAGPAQVVGYHACRAALTDPRLASSPGTAGRPERNLLLLDGDPHRAVRQVVAAQLASLDEAALRTWLAARAHAQVAAASPGTDLVADVIEPVVAATACHLLGLPDRLEAGIAPVLRTTVGLLDALVEGRRVEAMVPMARLATVVERDVVAGRAAGLRARLAAAQAAGTVDAGAAALTTPVVLHGGYENPVNLLGSLLHRILASPGPGPEPGPATRAAIHAHLAAAPPVRRLVRWAEVDAPDLGVRRGEPLLVDLASACQDPTVAPGDRPGRMAFGHGRHRCPGERQAVALAEAVVGAVAPPGRPTPTVVGAERHRTDLSDGVRRLLVRWPEPPP